MVITKLLEGTLSAGQTTITFTDSDIPNSFIRIGCTNPDLFPTEQSITGNVLTIKYEAQSSSLGVVVELAKAGMEIIDNLTSDDTDKALSAKQGKVLKDELDLKAVNSIQYYESKGFLSKNLFELDIDTETVPSNITYVDNGDGTVTVSSTVASGARYLVLGTYTIKANQTVKLVGCPSGGGASTHRLVLYYSGSVLVSDNGNGVTYTNDSGSDMTVNVSVRIAANYTSSNILFKPMISSDTDLTYSDFMQYAPSNTYLLNMIENLPSGGVNYSTSEQNTGLKWTDGKDIYQKSYEYTSISSGDNIFSFDLTSDCLVVDQKNTFINTSENMYWTDNNVSGNSINLVNTNYERTVINIASALAPYLSKATITVQYTKGN